MVKRAAGSQYMLLANNLIDKIGSGVYPPGSLLPSEQELGAQFNVSRITVRGALKELETKRLVSRRAGIGTRVEAPQQQPVFTHLGESVDEVLQFTKGIPVKVIERREIIVSSELARELELQEGQRFVLFEALRQKRGAAPVVHSHHYVPALLAPTSKELEGVQVSIAQWLAERHAHEVMTIRQQIAAVTLRRAEAEHLHAKIGAPALKSTRWYFGKEDTLLIASVSVFPGSQYTFKSTLRRNSAA